MALAFVNVIVFLAVCASAQKLRGGAADTKANAIKKAEANALKGGCRGSLCDTLPEDHFAVLMEKGNVVINIGVFDSKNETLKCVTHPTPVTCEENAANQGHRLNNKNMEYDDEFSVFVEGNQVCVRRVDKREGWGQELKIACKDAQAKNDKCMCLTSMEGDCACKGCSEEEQKQTCGELLGPCTCQRSEEGICDCHGYCHTRENRQGACEEEPGCQWTGMWCEAQVGLLWS
jgi:hypothetical protein